MVVFRAHPVPVSKMGPTSSPDYGNQRGISTHTKSPLIIRQGKKNIEGFVCLFVCLFHFSSLGLYIFSIFVIETSNLCLGTEIKQRWQSTAGKIKAPL